MVGWFSLWEPTLHERWSDPIWVNTACPKLSNVFPAVLGIRRVLVQWEASYEAADSWRSSAFAPLCLECQALRPLVFCTISKLMFLQTSSPLLSLLRNGCRPQPRQQYVRVAMKKKKSPQQKQWGILIGWAGIRPSLPHLAFSLLLGAAIVWC